MICEIGGHTKLKKMPITVELSTQTLNVHFFSHTQQHLSKPLQVQKQKRSFSLKSKRTEEEESEQSKSEQQQVASSPPKPKTRRSLKSLIAPIKLTDQAVERIKELIASKPDEEKTNIVGIRIGVKRRGCNGLSYTMNYVQVDNIPAKDEVVEKNGVKVFVDPLATMHIVGTEMDYEETELASEFTFNNPNAKGECGCGESFNT